MNKVQRKYYNAIKSAVEKLNLLNPADDLLIQDAAYCRLLIDEARQIVDAADAEKKHLQKFPTGAVQINPAINNLRGLQADWVKYCAILGLSPKGRKDLDAAATKAKPVSKIMQIKNRKVG